MKSKFYSTTAPSEVTQVTPKTEKLLSKKSTALQAQEEQAILLRENLLEAETAASTSREVLSDVSRKVKALVKKSNKELLSASTLLKLKYLILALNETQSEELKLKNLAKFLSESIVK